jgi:diphthamide biosynthesis enzyme Dph1/Dph2-like protein
MKNHRDQKKNISKVMFMEVRRRLKDTNLNLDILKDLPGKTISLAATIQYINLIPKVKSYLESKGKEVLIKQGAYHKGHVLGCNSSALEKSADTLLLITDGTFHAINNAIQLQKEIFVFNGNSLEKIEQKEVDNYLKRIQTKIKKFLLSDNIGLLVSSKHGQHQKGIHNIKKQIEKQNKKVYVFEANNINTNEFENFPQIQMWVNTACFGLARDDMKILNLSDIVDLLK